MGKVQPPSAIASLLVSAGVGRLTWCRRGGTIHIQVPAQDVMIGQRDHENDYLFVAPRDVPEVWAPVEVLEPLAKRSVTGGPLRRAGEDEE